MFNEGKIKNNSERDNEKILEIKDVFEKAVMNASDISKLFEDIKFFSEKLKNRYPDYMDYEFYHVLVGSTPRVEEKNGKDFPGDDSVEKFIKSL